MNLRGYLGALPLFLATLALCPDLHAAPKAAPEAGSSRVSTGRVVSVVLQLPKQAQIRGLRLAQSRTLLIEESQERDGTFSYSAKLAGDFTAVEDSVLILNRQDKLAKIAPGKLTEAFSVRVPILAERTPIQLEALFPDGKTQSLTGTLVARYEKARPSGLAGLLTGWQVAASFGPSLISHVETAAPSFSAWTMTAKAVADRRIQGPWSAGLLAYVTAVPLSASIAGLSPTFVGLSLRAGYATAWLRRPWSLNWSLGFYYTSMFGVDATYGFKNIHGLQPIPYPTLTRQLSSLSSLSLTPKFSPILATFPKGLFDHTQLAMSTKYTRRLPKGRNWFATLDYSKFTVKLGENKVNSSSLSLAGGFGF